MDFTRRDGVVISSYKNKNIIGYYIELLHTNRNIVSLFITAYVLKSKDYHPILNTRHGLRKYDWSLDIHD